MSFASSSLGLFVVGIGLGLLTNALFVVFGLERAALWLRSSVHWYCTAFCNFCYLRLWGSLLARAKRAVQRVEKRKFTALEEQYSACSTVNAARADGIEGGIDSITRRTIVAITRRLWPSSDGFAYLQLTFPSKDRSRLEDADAWVWVSPQLAQKTERVQPGFVKKAIASWQGALEHDATATLQIDGWAVLSGKPGEQIQLWRLEEGNVPVVTSACGSHIQGQNLLAAKIQVSTQDSSELLHTCSAQDKSTSGGSEMLCAQIPPHYNKASGVFVLAYQTDMKDAQELVYRSKATPFFVTRWCGFVPWVLNPCTWILLLAFAAVSMYLVFHRKARCTSAKTPSIEHHLITIAAQGLSPPTYDPVPGLAYKVAMLLVAVCLLAAIARNRIHHLLKFSLSTNNLVYGHVFGEVEEENIVCRVSQQQGEVSVLFCRQDKLSISNFGRRLSFPVIKSWSETSSRRLSPAQLTLLNMRSQSLK